MDDVKLALEALEDPRFQINTVAGENQVIVTESTVDVIKRELRKILAGGYFDCGDDPLCCHIHGHGAGVISDERVDAIIDVAQMDRTQEVQRRMVRDVLAAAPALDVDIDFEPDPAMMEPLEPVLTAEQLEREESEE